MDAWVLALAAASVGVRVMRVGIPVGLGERGCGEGAHFGGGEAFALQELRMAADAYAWASSSCVRGR